jgi:SAM-dependent methyltransferase
MADRDLLLYRAKLLRAERALDVGCGCGALTVELAAYAAHVTAIDISETLLHRCRRDKHRDNIDYQLMDGRQVGFPNDSFDLVACRSTLHHILDWENALDEMVRVARADILIEEPFDDPRSDGKRNTMRAQRLFLALQAEVDYPHYEYLTPGALVDQFKRNNLKFESEILASDEPVSFETYFEPWEFFANKSKRKDHWMQRLADFRKELGEGELCRNDVVLVAAHK